MADCLVFFEDSSNRLTTQLTDETRGPVVDADVTVVIVDENREPVTGMSWPQQLPLVSESTYSVVLTPDLEIVNAKSYFAQLVADSPTKGRLTWEALVRCQRATL
jgi:hypothetical protein